MRIIVAMSGGVDSSVAAARLTRAGHEVIGVTLHLWDYPDDGSVRGRCCAPEDVHDARRVSDKLGIPHYAFDRRELFEREVVTPFVESYLAGETPSPCVRCNRGVKLKELLTLASRLGADKVATGHYARIGEVDGEPRLLRAVDLSKDQSYFLHMVDADTLRRLHFPLGDATKAEVRAEALELELPGASKGESQELCFIPTGRYTEFVAERADGRLRPGPILDDSGKTVGHHEGIHRFTVGQRKNLGVAVGKRAYVVDIERDTNAVRLGNASDLKCQQALVSDVALAPGVSLPLSCEVAVRYRSSPVPARAELIDEDAIGTGRASSQGTPGARSMRVTFDEPVGAVVPGQFAVMYAGDQVLGGGTIQHSA